MTLARKNNFLKGEFTLDINAVLKEKIDIVDKHLLSYFPKKNNYQKTIYDAMEYSLFAGGKRIRPVLAMAVCEMLGGNIEDVMPFACGLEMIHTYSLIHDDLPCMDDDDLRRGKPTNHKVFGEGMAVLAGDGLLNCAFETALKFSKCSPEITLDCLNILSTASGTEGMIGGQVIDLEHEGKKIDSDTLETLHLLKTGALIQASAMLGSVCAEAPNSDIIRVSEFARLIGLAFQVKDDILDVLGDEKELGKPIGSDSENEKSTFVTLYGLEEAQKMLEDYTNKAISLLDVYKEKGEFLKEFSKYLLNRNK